LFLLTSVGDEQDLPADKKLRTLLDSGWYVFGESTPGRRRLKPGDRICFYRRKVGIVAEAIVASVPELKDDLLYNPDPEKYPWAFRVHRTRYFFDKPIVTDAAFRSRLDAYKGRNVDVQWGWFFQGTSIVTEHDFKLLVGRA
jgi:hypothetical protein